MSVLQKQTKQKLYIALGLVVFALLLMLFMFSGNNFDLLMNILKNDLTQEQLRDKLNDFGWRGYITVTVLAVLQILCAFLPAEPVQVLAGITFGFYIGFLCCIIGVFIGNTVIFLLHKSFGNKLSGYFVKKLRLDLNKIAKSKKCVLIIFILYFLPAISYGMICFFAASTRMRYKRFLLVTMLGALPSVCIGVGLGHMAIASNYIISIVVFAVLILLLILMFIFRERLFEAVNAFAEKNSKSEPNKVRKVNGFVMGVLYVVFRIYYLLCGVHIKPTNKVGKIESPSIVLCNHGSFIDFIFAAALIKRFKPHFIIARLYFYDKRLRALLRLVGGFPKSMFAADIESTKNCLSVLKNGEVLAMMPEARLSTTGRFEDIQDSTYSFIKKAGVNVYTIKFGGDYFADPKWGRGFRRGAVVEAELDILFTAHQVQQMSTGDIKAGVEQRLDYNEFEWLKDRPNIKYRSPRIAEGLENILTLCPKCNSKYTIVTKKDTVCCEKCGKLTSLDNRYAFTGDFRFKNLTEWYDWQKNQLEQQIIADENYSLTSNVKLRLPSNGNGLTRAAGQGVCTLGRNGLTYCGTKDGEPYEVNFPLERVYRLLFGAGENFEIYNGSEILYFVPDEKRSCVDWYMASMILYDTTFDE
ncbi:MAG: VTT domain-containing protein [Clostridia bacterium]|nr:VTT domain-containing protein [Clostridia bacterium]